MVMLFTTTCMYMYMYVVICHDIVIQVKRMLLSCMNTKEMTMAMVSECTWEYSNRIRVYCSVPKVCNGLGTSLRKSPSIYVAMCLNCVLYLTGTGGMDRHDDKVIFSHEEIAMFELRYENGYDLTHDPRYNMWLATHSVSHEGGQQLHVHVCTYSLHSEL